MKNLLLIMTIIGALSTLTGCAALVVGAAVGAAGGYEAAKRGYVLQSPVTKGKPSQTQEQK